MVFNSAKQKTNAVCTSAETKNRMGETLWYPIRAQGGCGSVIHISILFLKVVKMTTFKKVCLFMDNPL